jgi:hypothetical protein
MHFLATIRSVVAIALAAFVLSALPSTVRATVVTYDLSFDTTGQSIWDTGTSFTLDKTTFLGVAWEDKTVGFDAIVGDADTTVPNPLRLAYDIAFAACDLLFSASVCINGQTGQVGVVALGSRPSVRSCGTFAVACKIKKAADIVKRTAYDLAFKACDLVFPASDCRNGRPTLVPVIALGTAPASTLDIDTRTGAAVQGTTDGRIGLELGIEVDSGSVDATVSYQASFDIPDTTGLDKVDPISFNPSSSLAGANTLDTSFANLELSVDAIMELSGSVTAEGCILLTGCVTGGTSFDIAEKAPILSFNEGGEGGILLFGQSPSDLGLPPIADGFPIDIDVAGLATVTLYLPQPDATGGLDTSTNTLKATGQDDLVDIILDLDNIVATAAGVPGLFGSSIDIPVLGTLGFDIINVTMGPTVDLKQDFELTPSLFVNLLFDQAVMVGGELVTELISAWDLLPDITFLSDVTTVTPTFFLEAGLLNETLLAFDLAFGIDLLQIFYDFGLLGSNTFGIGNVLDEAVELFESPNLYSKFFPLGGFNIFQGQSFVIDFLNGSSAPDPIVLASLSNEVPEPGTIFLFVFGLWGLYALRRMGRYGNPLCLPSGARPVSVT